MNVVLKVAAAGIISAVCAVVIRKQVPELAILLAICGTILILLLCTGALTDVISFLHRLIDISGLASEFVEPVLRVTGIAIITKLSANFCRDAKEGSLATAVETAGNILALLAVLPLMSAVLDLLGDLL